MPQDAEQRRNAYYDTRQDKMRNQENSTQFGRAILPDPVPQVSPCGKFWIRPA